MKILIFIIWNCWKWAERTAHTVKHLMLKMLKKRYIYIQFSLLLKKKSKRKSNNSQLWRKRFKPSLSTITLSKKDKSIKISDLKSPNSKLSLEKDTLPFSKRSTASSQVLTHTLMLTLKETQSLLKKKLKFNIITTKTNNSLNIGSKPSFPTMLLVRK